MLNVSKLQIKDYNLIDFMYIEIKFGVVLVDTDL